MKNENDKLVKLKIMTPSGIFWDEPVEIVTVKTTEGYIGLQKNKSPFVASLDIAELLINPQSSNKHKICAIAGGLVIANTDHINIITDAIEYKEKIDLSRAEKAKRHAEQSIKSVKSEAEHQLASIALKRALNRIEVRTHNK